ncbi:MULTISPECIES: tyrosine-type recombinase/integrase [Mesorhizobium]|uniref:Integrase n=2 Tax=Mesorhizobium TaxID=68287 RepID=A0A1A5ICP9_RHILI|nr:MULTISPECIES: site-specific integrase [Mesorhizobium]ETA72668.1 site-specific recombinase XerD [Mesorhizobium japonicum R7A]MBE1711169.1 site-specific integrase [Mesorhizobium japonicum]MBE1714662.1 site-specific integrase [Mesorhizobium japonicum]MUT22273.1 tyrosine-type recombinase/integrase [Mesorhizobium japonicum]MUT28306.1 tyrosine-type recombinase/integrase [Mesorhizobium japonicum]
MATLRKRNGRWQVQVRRQGFPTQSRSFVSKADANEWARLIERQHDRQELGPDRKALKTMTLADLVTRYRDEVVPKKRGSVVETILLNRFLRYPICQKTLNDLTTADFAAYRDQRLKEPKHRSNKPVTPKSLKRELSPLSHMFRHAVIEWEIPLRNPLYGLKLKVTDNKRERRLLGGELERLLEATKKSRNKLVAPIILFALETAMRRGEMLSIQFRHVDFGRLSLVIPESKSGYSRVIPLTQRAVAILEALRSEDAKPTDLAFPITPIALRLQWDRLTARAGIDGLNFHDLRHEAISRLFELGLTVPEVASISGHRTLAQLMRYSHANHEAVRAKLIGERRPQALMVETASVPDTTVELIN